MRARLQETAWIRNYLPDLESDFSVFHRVDDMYALPAAVFVSRAERMYAYKGALRMRAEMESSDSRSSTTSTQQPAARPVDDWPREMDLAALMVTQPGLIEKATA